MKITRLNPLMFVTRTLHLVKNVKNAKSYKSLLITMTQRVLYTLVIRITANDFETIK